MSKIKKIPTNLRLHPNTIKQIKELAKLEGESQSKIVEYAIDLLEQSKNDHKRRFMEIYHSVGKAEQMLEYARDYNPENGTPAKDNEDFHTKEQRQVYNFYGRMWDEMRKLPFFNEIQPSVLEDDF